ncbi:MAG: ElyC/SanA/YdcF family protein [Kiritimatiellia bacterium]|nr:ElyC/SanA/YdcF family protein [Kiritimatiellia bacterium]
MWTLIRRKTVWRPAPAGWLLLLLLTTVVLGLAPTRLYRFLAPSQEPAGDYLVVEGWVPDEGLPWIVSQFAGRNYRAVISTGGPIEVGRFLSEYGDWAQVGAARLIQAGIPRELVTAVPADTVQKDRTYASALALRKHFAALGVPSDVKIDLVTVGPHARRSRRLFLKALGPEARVNALTIAPDIYQEKNWWRTSEGFRTVLYETLAYGYTRIWLLTE